MPADGKPHDDLPDCDWCEHPETLHDSEDGCLALSASSYDCACNCYDYKQP